MIKNASYVSDYYTKELLPVLVPSHLAANKHKDGCIYETGSEDVTNPENDRECLYESPVARIPFGAEALHDTRLVEQGFGYSLIRDLELADALERNDKQTAEEISGQGVSDEVVLSGLNSRELSPQEKLALHLTDALAHVKYVIWRENSSGKLRPGLLCTTREQVGYALLAGSLGRPGGLGVCKRCGKLFQKERASQPYCSANCRVAEAVKRYRERKKHQRRKRKARQSKTASKEKP